MDNLIDMGVHTGRNAVGPMINLHEVSEFVNLVEQAYREEEQKEFIELYFDLQFRMKDKESFTWFELRNPEYPLISEEDDNLYESFMNAIDHLNYLDDTDQDTYEAYVIDVANKLRVGHYDYRSYQPSFGPTFSDKKVKHVSVDLGFQKHSFASFSEVDMFIKSLNMPLPAKIIFEIIFFDDYGSGYEFVYRLNYVLTPPDMKYFSAYALLRSYSDMIRRIYERFAENVLIWFSEEHLGALKASYLNWDLENKTE